MKIILTLIINIKENYIISKEKVGPLQKETDNGRKRENLWI